MTAPPHDDQEGVDERLRSIRGTIRELGVDPATIEIVAVTKARPIEVVHAARRAGLTAIGENYAQELVAKATTPEMLVDQAVRWHAIGQLQTNKVRMLAEHVALWQAVDRLKLGREIARRAAGARVLVQVNVSDEPQKGGCTPDETAGLVDALAGLGLEVDGLMAVASAAGGAVAAEQFATLRRLVDRLGLSTCSMGMSGDYREAVAEGATMLRLGTALVGPRLDATD